MKLLVSILASIVLFLSTQCIIMGSNMAMKASPVKKSCCSKKKTCSKPAKEEKEKDCKDACNPFMACCGCLYDGIPKNDITIDKPFVNSVKNGCKEISFLSTYIPDSWQPPEIVI